MKSVLRLEKVTKKFEGLVAVNELSIDMKARTIHALIGPNGSGKSTTINMHLSQYLGENLSWGN